MRCRRNHRVILAGIRNRQQLRLRAELRLIEEMQLALGKLCLIAQRAFMKHPALRFDMFANRAVIRLAVFSSLEANEIAHQNLVGPGRIIHALPPARIIGRRKFLAKRRKLFFQHQDFRAQIGIVQIVEQRRHIFRRADAADPGAVIAGRSRKRIHIARHIKPALVAAIRMGQALITQNLFRARNDPRVNGGIGDVRVIHLQKRHRRTPPLRLGHAKLQHADAPPPTH